MKNPAACLLSDGKSTTLKLNRHGDPLTPIKTYWRFASDGVQLSAGLWWAAYIAPSEKQMGKWWWKTTACGENPVDTGPCGYADTPEEAISKVHGALKGDRLYDYTLPTEAEGVQWLQRVSDRCKS